MAHNHVGWWVYVLCAIWPVGGLAVLTWNMAKDDGVGRALRWLTFVVACLTAAGAVELWVTSALT